ncbi:MAG: DegT/DnrJ/EryC1/StrS aminotransferase family protein [Hyphomicrobiales bacterium]
MKFIDLQAQRQRLEPSLSQSIGTILDHGRFIMGPEVVQLEEALQEYVGAKHCISVANGTDALQIALMAAGVGFGDEVITPSFTYVATCEAAAVIGAIPVMVDIDPKTYCLDPVEAEKAITSKTKAIIAVSLYGQCADMDALVQISKTNGITLIEDAAQSFGSTHKNVRSCALSDIATTSFFPTKPLGCYGDGGALFTDSDDLAAEIKLIARHGQTRRYQHERVGMNSRLDTLQAGVLLEKLRIFDDEVALRAEVGKRYETLLTEHGLNAHFVHPDNSCVFAQYTVRVKNREQVMARMAEDDVPTMVHYPKPLHRQPAYLADVSLPLSEQAADEVMSLPMHPYLSEEDQKIVVGSLAKALKSE